MYRSREKKELRNPNTEAKGRGQEPEKKIGKRWRRRKKIGHKKEQNQGRRLSRRVKPTMA